MNKILVIEDDKMLNEMIAEILIKNDFEVDCCFNGEMALKKMEHECYSLIISDIMMPVMDGFDFISQVRKNNKFLPVLFISAKYSFEDKQKAFESGIDDYMVKPVDLNELLLRVNALLRRAKISVDKKIIFGKTVLDYDSFVVLVDNNPINLTQKEFLLLFKLLSYPNKIFTRRQLMNEIWGLENEKTGRTVDVHITKLREKFSNNNDFEIVTIHGLGYKAIKKRII